MIKPLADTATEEWRRELQRNAETAFAVSVPRCRCCASARRGHQLRFARSAACAGAARCLQRGQGSGGALTRALAIEEKQHGVRANALAPGMIDTEQNRKSVRIRTRNGYRGSRSPTSCCSWRVTQRRPLRVKRSRCWAKALVERRERQREQTQSAIGRVVGTERKPNTPHEFHFWTAPDSDVGIGTLVKVVIDAPRALTVYGIVVDGASYTDLQTALHDYIGLQADPSPAFAVGDRAPGDSSLYRGSAPARAARAAAAGAIRRGVPSKR